MELHELIETAAEDRRFRNGGGGDRCQRMPKYEDFICPCHCWQLIRKQTLCLQLKILPTTWVNVDLSPELTENNLALLTPWFQPCETGNNESGIPHCAQAPDLQTVKWSSVVWIYGNLRVIRNKYTNLKENALLHMQAVCKCLVFIWTFSYHTDCHWSY